MHTPVEEKRAGQEFWNSNPCGGQWVDYRSFFNWYIGVEPYATDTLDRYTWTNVRVLEIGCGQGVLLNYIVERGADAFGVDMSSVSVTRTKAGAGELGQANRVHVCVADAESLPFPDDAFDAIVSFGVLHHTPDTAASIRQLRRTLKPGGIAIVMLYRTGNPKWWAVRVIRAISGAASWVSRRTAWITGRLRATTSAGDPHGTALLELFGVPTMQAFSNADAVAMFEGFSEVVVRNCSPGFRRLADISPLLRPFAGLLAAIDRATDQAWGFYQVLEARR